MKPGVDERREQELVRIYAVTALLLIVVLVQLVLLNVSISSFMERESGILFATTCASGLVFLTVRFLIRSISSSSSRGH